jgi:ankyrin repeat protein
MDIHAAAKHGDIVTVAEILESDRNIIDTLDSSGESALHLAIRNDHVNIVELLIKSGSNMIDTPNKHGYVPIHMAVLNSKKQMIELLIRSGVKNVDTPTDSGNTSLYLAALRGDADILELIIKMGSSTIDTLNSFDETPLLLAVKFTNHWKTSLMKTLLAFSSINSQNDYLRHCSTRGITPIIVTEDDVCDARYRVYFCWSATRLLLNWLEPPPKITYSVEKVEIRTNC